MAQSLDSKKETKASSVLLPFHGSVVNLTKSGILSTFISFFQDLGTDVFAFPWMR